MYIVKWETLDGVKNQSKPLSLNRAIRLMQWCMKWFPENKHEVEFIKED